MHAGFLRSGLLFLCSILIIFLFFRPWLYLEIAPVNGPQLISMAAEYFEKSSIMNRLIYLVYLIPVSALFILVSIIFKRRAGLILAKAILFLTSASFFTIIFQFQLSDEMNLYMALACYVTTILSISIFIEEWLFNIRMRRIKN